MKAATKKRLPYIAFAVFLALNIFYVKKPEPLKGLEIKFCGKEIPVNEPRVKEDLQKAILRMKKAYGKRIDSLGSNFLFSFIDEELQRTGLDPDLKYVPVAESGLNPRAVSNKNAFGLWQFISSTGREYDLSQNSVIDLRFDPFASTKAALDYLKDLYKRFKDWPDALAGYNMNQDDYAKTKYEQNAKNFYQVKDIPQETRELVFNIIALKLMFENPKEYGIRKTLPYQYIYRNWEVKKVPIEVQGEISVQQIIESLKNRYPDWNSAEFPDYNSHLLKQTLPPGSYYVYVKLNGTS